MICLRYSSAFRRQIWTSARTCMLERLPAAAAVRGGGVADDAHWAKRDKAGHPRKFKNPWPSYDKGGLGLLRILKILLFHPKRVPVPDNIGEIYKVVTPIWHDYARDRVRATWIGHATFLVELPKLYPAQARGLRILFDPVCTQYTAPSWARKLKLGPKRYSALPCQASDLPEVDVIAISHNHYDHLDEVAIEHLERASGGTMQYLVGLNNRHVFTSLGVEGARVHEMDWWERGRLTCEGLRIPQHLLDAEDAEKCADVAVTVHCLPSQHNSGRGLTDQNHSLWCSWLIETPETRHSASKKIYFAGDTGYMTTPGDDRLLPLSQTLQTQADAEREKPPDRPTRKPQAEGAESAYTSATSGTMASSTHGTSTTTGRSASALSQAEQPVSTPAATDGALDRIASDAPAARATYPTCPIFAHIGAQFGPLDLCMLPIGLYSPRSALSAVHMCPEDAVDVHRELRSKQSIACHFATFRGGLSRNFEDVTHPPLRLKKYMREVGVPEGEFQVLDIGGSIEV